MAHSNRIIINLLKHWVDDGVTLFADGVTATKGIAVGGASAEFSVQADWPIIEPDAFVKAFVKLTDHDQVSGYGMWRDGNRIVLERVDIYPTTQVIPALLKGRERNQKYMYHIDTDTMLEV